ncbi:heterokaryon incompatibility protein-domain-containing protein [Xylariaceae sp. AK1471]|nr:heterokaryon incompatibility protein-domain-containing protein [Xylariaceae sp. AK1471]
MFNLSSALTEVRRSEGAIRLEPREPPEKPPWVDRDDDEQQSGARPAAPRRFKVRLNPPAPRRTATKKSQSFPASYTATSISAKYRPLLTNSKTGQAEFRLLKILPGKGSEPLCCELIYSRIANPPEYEALSYCWGSATLVAEVRCDGILISVSTNLAAALQVFRREISSRMLWVDAICINQNDVGEKEYQVPLMGQIYSKAIAVQIWLGNDTPEYTCATAFTIFRNLKNLCVRFGWDIDFAYLVRYRALQGYGLPDVVEDSWRCIRHLVEMPWFTRTWVIQEVTLSRQAYLQCGNSSLPWIDFCVGFLSLNQTFLMYRPDIVPSISSYTQAMQLILSYHKAGASFSDLDFPALLENHRVARTTDARDKIYAFLGLYELKSGRSHNIIPNYRGTVTEIFVNVAKEIVEQSKTLDILGVPRQDSQNRVDGLPSWVPDWSSNNFATSLTCRTIDGSYLFTFDAAKTPEVPAQAKTQDWTLQLCGFCFGEVTEVGYLADLHFKQEDDTSHARLSPVSSTINSIALLRNWLTVSRGLSKRKYPNGQNAFEAFVRTIYLDHFSSSYSVDEAVNYYRCLYDPSYVLGKPWFGAFRISFVQRYAYFQFGVVGKAFGAAPIKALAKVLGWMEGVLPVYGYYDIDRPPHLSGRSLNECLVDTRARTMYRKMVYTKSGYIGLGPRLTQEGDRVFLVKGSRTPLLLRPQQQNGTWELLGDCYVHGIMQAEAFDETKCETFVVI